MLMPVQLLFLHNKTASLAVTVTVSSRVTVSSVVTVSSSVVTVSRGCD